MALYRVEVDVATARPPRAHATAYVTLEADGWIDAELTAIYMVMGSRDCIVMPVATRHELIIDEEERAHYEDHRVEEPAA